MDLHRISVKYFLEDGAAPDLPAMIPVFHRWIQQSAVPGLLIDVADYKHMVDGPGVMLIGHDVDYSLDQTSGRPGLLHTRKRAFADDFQASLASVFHAALTACRALEKEPTVAGKLRFRTDEAHLVVPDRLRAANSDATFEQLRGDVEAFVTSLYEGTAVSLARDAEDERRCFAITISAPDGPALDTLIERLSASAASA